MGRECEQQVSFNKNVNYKETGIYNKKKIAESR